MAVTARNDFENVYIDENGWIPVSDMLPEEGQECFVWFSNEGISPKRSWCYTKFYDDRFCDVDCVTHWRPVFKEPKKEIVDVDIREIIRICDENIATIVIALERLKSCQH
jgi:hypothetical protein